MEKLISELQGLSLIYDNNPDDYEKGFKGGVLAAIALINNYNKHNVKNCTTCFYGDYDDNVRPCSKCWGCDKYTPSK